MLLAVEPPILIAQTYQFQFEYADFDPLRNMVNNIRLHVLSLLHVGVQIFSKRSSSLVPLRATTFSDYILLSRAIEF